LNLPSPLPTGRALVPIGKNPQGHDEYWRTRDGAVMVKVPSGEFTMGSAPDEGEPAQRPQRRPYISEFMIDKTEVTWRQFRRYAKATGAGLPPTPLWGALEDYPVTSVLFAEAKAYCEWVGGRLPTESEWEKAARGTDGRKYTWGNQWDSDRCNSIDGGPHRPAAVGNFPGCVSPYGVVDMAGSLWEWTTDWYADGYPEVSEQDPKGPGHGTHRVVRGGSWLWSRFFLYAAYRHKIEPGWRDVHNGFRCARSVPH
jgi:formylglycine-generating enzyme required for sulfatase activity